MIKSTRLSIVLLLTIISFCQQVYAAEMYKQIIDTDYFFSCSVPVSWDVEKSKDITSFWRFLVTSPNKSRVVGFYSFHIESNVDLKRLAEADSEIFNNLGRVICNYQIKKWWIVTKAIDKTYYNKETHIYSYARFLTDGTYAYIIIAYSRSKRFDWLLPILNSFKSRVPFSINFNNILSGVKRQAPKKIFTDSILAVLPLLATVVVPISLGLIGYATRKTFFGLILVFLLPICISGYLIAIHMKWLLAILIGAICMALIGIGRGGVLIWME